MFSWSGKRYKGWEAKVGPYSSFYGHWPVTVTGPDGHVFSVTTVDAISAKRAAKKAIKYYQDQSKPKSPYVAEYKF